MAIRRPLGLALTCAGFLACQDASIVSSESPTLPAPSFSGAADAPASASGGGYYEIAGLPPIQFAFTAVQLPGGGASGSFRHVLDLGADGTVDVSGTVICVTQDPATGRAWIGALVTRNASTLDGFQEDIHQPGEHAWFRVLDEGDADRTTFLGFKGAAGLDTSPQYCEARIWPNEPVPNARTSPVIKGNITVRP